MAETIVVLLIAAIAFVFSVRWFYQTVAGKSEGCGCNESSSCPTISTCEPTTGNTNRCKEI